MQTLMGLLTKSQKKAEMAVLDIALFYIIMIKKLIKKLLLLVVDEAALLGTELTLQVVVKVVAQATMLNILLAAER